jgi:hypothetical protein
VRRRLRDHVKIRAQQVASIVSRLAESADELSPAWWQIELVAGLIHLKAMNPEVFMPILTCWLDGQRPLRR